MTNPAAGMYPDPSRPNMKRAWRYWDGSKWSNFDPTPAATRKEANPPELVDSALAALAVPDGKHAPSGRSGGGPGTFIAGFIAGLIVWGIILYFAQLGIVVWVITSIVAAAISGAVITARANKTSRALDGGNTGSYFGLSFDATTITYSGQRQPIKGVSVVLETAGSLNKRLNVPNMLVGGALLGPVGLVLGATDKIDDSRELYLLVTGAERQWAIPVSPKDGLVARKFAARVNTAGMSA